VSDVPLFEEASDMCPKEGNFLLLLLFPAFLDSGLGNRYG
jgi:hypothetical protein